MSRMLIGIIIGALLGRGLGALIATSNEDEFFLRQRRAGHRGAGPF